MNYNRYRLRWTKGTLRGNSKSVSPNIYKRTPNNEPQQNVQDVNGKKHKFEFWSLIVNVVIGGSAVWVLIQNYDTLDASRVSAFYTYKSVKQTEDIIKKQAIKDSLDAIRDSLDYINDTTAVSINKTSMIKNLEMGLIERKLSAASVLGQLKFAEENHKQFRLDNQPYLECRNFRVTQLEPDKPIRVDFELVNIGKHTTKVVSAQVGHYMGNDVHPDRADSLMIFGGTTNKLISYLSNGVPAVKKYNSDDNISKEIVDALKEGLIGLFLFGNIGYYDDVNQTDSMYSFYVFIDLSSDGYDMIKSDNGSITYVKDKPYRSP